MDSAPYPIFNKLLVSTRQAACAGFCAQIYSQKRCSNAVCVVEIEVRLHVYFRRLVAVLDSLCQAAQVAAETCLVQHKLAVASYVFLTTNFIHGRNATTDVKNIARL